MNVLLITDSYPPEIRSAAELMHELAIELAMRGHNVTVVTSYPRYNLSDKARTQTFEQVVLEDTIRVIRVKNPPHHNVGKVRRGLAELLLRRVLWRTVRNLVSAPVDSVLVYSPPLPLAWVGARAKRAYGARFVLNAQDLFPQNAIDLGILRSRLLIRFFAGMERRAYRAADAVVVHSDGNREFLTNEKAVPEDKVSVIHNWIDVDRFRAAQGKYRSRYGLDGRFVILFAGVMGPSQGLSLVIEAARRLRHVSELVFLLVGDGGERETLQAAAKEHKLTNVMFQPFVSADEYPELVGSADVGLVCLSASNHTPVVPAKILGYMAAGIPVIAALQKSSDAHRLIAESNCGLSTVSDDPDNLVRMVEAIMRSPDRVALGSNGRRYAINHYSKRVCVDRLETLLNHDRSSLS